MTIFSAPWCCQHPADSLPEGLSRAEGDPGRLLSSARPSSKVTGLTMARTPLPAAWAFSPTSPRLRMLSLAGFLKPTLETAGAKAVGGDLTHVAP